LPGPRHKRSYRPTVRDAIRVFDKAKPDPDVVDARLAYGAPLQLLLQSGPWPQVRDLHPHVSHYLEVERSGLHHASEASQLDEVDQGSEGGVDGHEAA